MNVDVVELTSLERDAFAEIANMGVSRAAASLRQMLGETRGENRYIATVARKGYRFVAKVKRCDEPVVAAPSIAAPGATRRRNVLLAAGAAVLGLSTQDTGYQQEMVTRLRLPFPVLSDATLALTRAMRLPTFTVAGHELLRRLTLVLRGGVVEHVFYPVFPPDTHVEQVLDWLREHPVATGVTTD